MLMGRLKVKSTCREARVDSVSLTLGDQVNSLTHRTKQAQSQCDCVRFNYSEVA